MIPRHEFVLLLAVSLIPGTWAGKFNGASGTVSTETSTRDLVNTCLITNDVTRLVDFYKQVLEVPPKPDTDNYAEFHTGMGVLAIFSAIAQEKYIPRSAEPEKTRVRFWSLK